MSHSDPTVPKDPGPGGASAHPADTARGTTRVVKRYNNRKLYDTVESRYVTLPQIAELVRRGEDVRIIDNNTKEDLTSMTLAQILYEEERKQSRPLPLTALKDLLHASGERFISTLREGPVGKLIGRTDAPTEAPPGDHVADPTAETPSADPLGTPPPMETPGGATNTANVQGVSATASPAATRVQQLVEQSREALDQWQHRMDDRMKTFWESINPAGQIQALQAEVRRLQGRIEVLEGHEVRKAPPKAPPESDTDGLSVETTKGPGTDQKE